MSAATRLALLPICRRASRLQVRPPAVSGRYFGKVDGAAGQTPATRGHRQRREPLRL